MVNFFDFLDYLLNSLKFSQSIFLRGLGKYYINFSFLSNLLINYYSQSHRNYTGTGLLCVLAYTVSWTISGIRRHIVHLIQPDLNGASRLVSGGETD
jgi:hypothetical protein